MSPKTADLLGAEGLALPPRSRRHPPPAPAAPPDCGPTRGGSTSGQGPHGHGHAQHLLVSPQSTKALLWPLSLPSPRLPQGPRSTNSPPLPTPSLPRSCPGPRPISPQGPAALTSRRGTGVQDPCLATILGGFGPLPQILDFGLLPEKAGVSEQLVFFSRWDAHSFTAGLIGGEKGPPPLPPLWGGSPAPRAQLPGEVAAPILKAFRKCFSFVLFYLEISQIFTKLKTQPQECVAWVDDWHKQPLPHCPASPPNHCPPTQQQKNAKHV